MLLNLYIKNLGIIDTLKMDFQAGFNVLTGETGAGKSIIVESLLIATGCRASEEYIRSGAEKALVQAAFDISGLKPVASLLAEQGLEQPEDGILVLLREINRHGKNICRVNGQVVPLGLYRSIGTRLVDLHVQHEQNSLLDPDRHGRLLDRFGGPAVIGALEEVKALYDRWKEARQRYDRLRADEGERNRRMDMLRFQVEEIERAGLKPDEEEELEAEKRVLANAEKISLLTAKARSLLYDRGGGQASAVDLLSEAVSLLKSLADLDRRPVEILTALEEALYQVEDAARELAVYGEGLECNPQRLEEVEQRLLLIKKLKKKYGGTVREVLAYLESARNELGMLDNAEEALEAAAGEADRLMDAYSRAAEVLSRARREAARRLEEGMGRELISLEMGRVEFKVAFTPLDGPNRQGAERVEFLLSPNTGEPLKPLAKIASGGELTRIMLALKSLLAEADDVPVLVFDEAEAGIGGRALQSVAEKLSQLGEGHQVICVTHSAKVASYAGTHYRIVKEFDGERTVARVKLLDRQERLEELARMLGGRDITEITLLHAGQMLQMASKN
ncbi:ATPase involved in DNA repair [Pelotomaculum thermopropionicum SI]|uniref:DNA repair protein RecN n=1 Tax=Pelotomaculum thermopropionicum (strain DSM 13744 / JCM 10971 / SI) TaxID=370438 RepID=A5D301_PELTS|nr:ATPase involved in DNA repair [Pelotomaculum thermopropionicum SI]